MSKSRQQTATAGAQALALRTRSGGTAQIARPAPKPKAIPLRLVLAFIVDGRQQIGQVSAEGVLEPPPDGTPAELRIGLDARQLAALLVQAGLVAPAGAQSGQSAQGAPTSGPAAPLWVPRR